MRVLSKLVLIGGLALSCGGMPALAQTVALPLEPSPQGSAPDSSSSPFVPAPDYNQPAQPQYPQAVPGRQSVPAVPMAAPSARPGLATPAANRQALAVPGFTPDQVAAARRSFEALAATNPELAKLNPFARVDMLKEQQALQDDLSKKIRAACGLDYFNVMLPNALMEDPVKLGNFKSYGVGAIVGAMRSVCGDSKVKDAIGQGIGVFNVQHRDGLTKPEIESQMMSVVFRYDFTLKEPPSVGLMADALIDAAQKSADSAKKVAASFENVDQDEMKRRMESLTKSQNVR